MTNKRKPPNIRLNFFHFTFWSNYYVFLEYNKLIGNLCNASESLRKYDFFLFVYME